MGWKDTIQDIPKGGWRDTITEGPSSLESIGRGAAQGASLGWGEELSALVELGMGKLTGNEAYKDATYSELRDQNRAINLAAKKANPKLYGGSEIVSSLPALIATAGKASSIPALMGVGAGQGATLAAGASEASPVDDTWQFMKDTGIGTAIGVGAGTVTPYAGKGIKKIGQWIRPGAKVVEEATEAGAKQVVSEVDDATGAYINRLKSTGGDADEALAAKLADDFVPAEAVEGANKSAAKLHMKRPPITHADEVLAKMGEKDANVVAYARNRGGENTLKKAPSLDSNVANGIRNQFDDAVETVSKKLKAYEKKAGDLIENSNVSMTNNDLAGIIQKEITSIEGTGLAATKPGKAAISELAEKLKFFLKKVKKGKKEVWVVEPGQKDAKWIREFLQGLRQENKSFFNKIRSGEAYSSANEAIQNLSKNLDEFLKDRVPGYVKIMTPYSKDLKAYLGIKKSMGRQVVADFFTNKVKKPAQDILFGVRDVGESWVKVLADFGDASGTDFIGMVKDRLAYAHLFPGKVTTAEMPSVTQNVAGMSHRLLQSVVSPRGAIVGTGIDVAKKATKGLNKWRFEKGLEKQIQKATMPTKPPGLIKKGLDFAKDITGYIPEKVGQGIASPYAKAGAVSYTSPEGTSASLQENKLDKDAAIKLFSQKYEPVLKKAIDRGGGHSLAVTNYLLQQQDSEYRKLLNDVFENSE